MLKLKNSIDLLSNNPNTSINLNDAEKIAKQKKEIPIVSSHIGVHENTVKQLRNACVQELNQSLCSITKKEKNFD